MFWAGAGVPVLQAVDCFFGLPTGLKLDLLHGRERSLCMWVGLWPGAEVGVWSACCHPWPASACPVPNTVYIVPVASPADFVLPRLLRPPLGPTRTCKTRHGGNITTEMEHDV